jgi:hypothetical protein
VHKNEMIVAQAQVSAMKFADACRLARTLVSAAAAVWAVSLVVGGIVQIAQGHPDAITATARIVEAFKLDQLVWAIIAGACGVGWTLERRGKKRAVAQLGAARRRLEKGDSYRGTSGLHQDGSTPQEVQDD